MNYSEVENMILELRKIEFSSCEEYISDLIDNYAYPEKEIVWLKLQLASLHTSGRKYTRAFKIISGLLDSITVRDTAIGQDKDLVH